VREIFFKDLVQDCYGFCTERMPLRRHAPAGCVAGVISSSAPTATHVYTANEQLLHGIKCSDEGMMMNPPKCSRGYPEGIQTIAPHTSSPYVIADIF